MPERDRLLAEEAAGAVALAGVLAQIPEERWAEPTVTPDGWTPIVVAGHVAAWLDECTRVLRAMAEGTWDAAAEPEETPASVAAMNAGPRAICTSSSWWRCSGVSGCVLSTSRPLVR